MKLIIHHVYNYLMMNTSLCGIDMFFLQAHNPSLEEIVYGMWNQLLNVNNFAILFFILLTIAFKSSLCWMLIVVDEGYDYWKFSLNEKQCLQINWFKLENFILQRKRGTKENGKKEWEWENLCCDGPLAFRIMFSA